MNTITINNQANIDTKHRRLLPKICTGKSTCCIKTYCCQVILNNNSIVLKNNNNNNNNKSCNKY